MIATTLSLIKSVAGADPAGLAKYMPSAECFKTSGFLFFRRVFNICRRLPTSYPPFFAYGICNKGDTHGTRAGPRNRRDNNTDLSDFDLRPGGLGPAQRVRIRPDSEPHPRRAGAKSRRARRRPRRPLLRFGNVGYRHHAETARAG